MTRVTVTLRQDEREALCLLAARERRDPRDQAAMLIRNELKRRGLLPCDEQCGEVEEVSGNGDH